MFEMFPLLASVAAPIISSIIGNVGAQQRQDAMNAYNNPVNQMQRYAQAGLNPNLIYGQGTPGNQASAVPFMTPDVDPVKIWSAANAVKESRMRRQSLYWKSRAQELLGDYQSIKNSALGPELPKQAGYQTSIMRHQIQNMAINWGLTATRGEGAVLDNRIKSIIEKIQKQNLESGEYYNRLRDFGVERGDNPLYRMGSLILHKYVPHVRLKP